MRFRLEIGFRQDLNAEGMVKSLKVSPGPLPLNRFLRDADALGFKPPSQSRKTGEKWKAAFDDISSKLGDAPLLD